MRRQTARRRELLPTCLTLERAQQRMRDAVLFEVKRLSEMQVTLMTRVWLVARMDSHVTYERVPTREPLGAFSALVWPFPRVVSHVRLERVPMSKCCLAQCAFEGALPRVTPEVGQKIAGFREDLLANAADVGLAQALQLLMIDCKMEWEQLTHQSKMVIITHIQSFIL